MQTLKKYFEINNLTAYRVGKENGIPNQTINRQLNNDTLDGLSIKIIKAIAISTNKTPGTVVDELVELDENKDA